MFEKLLTESRVECDVRLLIVAWIATILVIFLWMPKPKGNHHTDSVDPDIEVARKFLRENAGGFGLLPTTSDLLLSEVRPFAGGKHVRFQQFHERIPVHDGMVNVTVRVDGAISFAVSSYKTNIHVPTIPVSQEFRDVERTIDGRLGTSADQRVSTGHLVVFRDPSGADHVAWHFTGGGPSVVVSEFIVDAASLEVLSAQSVQVYAEATASELREFFPTYRDPGLITKSRP